MKDRVTSFRLNLLSYRQNGEKGNIMKALNVEEIKAVLNEKCSESWYYLNDIEYLFGANSVRSEKARDKWATYDSLFRELFNEVPRYKSN